MVAVIASLIVLVGAIFCMHWFAQFTVDFFGSAVKNLRNKEYSDATWNLFFGICMFAGIVLVLLFAIALSGIFLGVL